VQRWGKPVVSSILAQPVREDGLMAAPVPSFSTYGRISLPKEEIATLKDSIEARRIIEKAKGPTRPGAASRKKNKAVDSGVPITYISRL
jgi:AmiR/NasT family two-component response regulator